MSDDKTTLERLKAELGELRASLDHLRVKANLGRMEARDKLHDLEERLEPASREAKRLLNAIVTNGTIEARALGKGLLAGWEELRRAHRELTLEAEQKHSKRRKGTS